MRSFYENFAVPDVFTRPIKVYIYVYMQTRIEKIKIVDLLGPNMSCFQNFLMGSE